MMAEIDEITAINERVGSDINIFTLKTRERENHEKNFISRFELPSMQRVSDLSLPRKKFPSKF
jgi:hypothetical protein